MSSKRLSLSEIRGLASRLLQRAGLNEKASDVVARRIADAERDGCRSHGMFRLPHWHKALTSGRTRRDSIPEVEIRGDSAVALSLVSRLNQLRQQVQGNRNCFND